MPRTERPLLRANAIETDINAPLMAKMKGFSIKLDRIEVVEKHTLRSNSLVESKSVAVANTSQQVKRRGRPVTKKTDKDESQPNATASTSQPAKGRGRPPSKRRNESSKRQLNETHSGESQPNATASTSQQAKHRRQQPAKSNIEAKKRALRSNSSIDDISYEIPEQRTKRKKRAAPLNELQDIIPESSDDEQVMADAKNNAHVTVRRPKNNNSYSTDGDVSKSIFDNQSIESDHSDASETEPVTSKLANSTLLHGKIPLPNLYESDNEMTPFLSEKLQSPERRSENGPPRREILLGDESRTVQQNTMDPPMDETHRNVTKSKEIQKMHMLKSTFGKVGEPSTSIDNNRSDPEQIGEMCTTYNRQHSEEAINETADSSDDEQSEDQVAEKTKKNNQSIDSIFDTPDDMESDNVETDAVVNASSMIDTDKNVGQTSAMSVEENNNMKAPTKQTADVARPITVHRERHEVEENVATISQGSTAPPNNVLNELKDVLENRNERKKADEARFESVQDAAHHHKGPSDISTLVEHPIDAENGLMAHDMHQNASHNEALDMDMNSNSEAEHDLREPAPYTSAFRNSTPKAGNKRRMPAAPTPNIIINKPLININVTSDDEESGPNTSASEASPPKPRNKRKLPPVDVYQQNMPGPFNMLAKIPNYTRHGFLEESFYEPPTNGIFVFNAQPNGVNIAMDSFQPKKRQRIIEIEPDEVIFIKQSKKRPKKKVFQRRASD